MNDRAGHQTSKSPLADFHAAVDRKEAEADATFSDLQTVLARARALAEKLPRSRETSVVMWRYRAEGVRVEVSNG